MAGSVIGALRVNLGLDSAQFTKGVANAQSAMKGMSVKMAVAGAAIGAALGTAAASFIKLGRDAINTADEISKSAVKIGLSTEELSRLRYAADLSGVSFEQLEKGLLILNRNMAGVGGESKKVAEAFAAMGIETRNADGTLKSSTEVLKAMADVFKGMPDGAQKSALAMAVLGKSGADMIPLINGGSEALQQLTDEADKFGIVIDTETGLKAEAFNDNLTRLQGVFGALATQVAAEMLPVLVDLTDSLVRNADKIRGFAKGVSETITYVGQLGRGVSELTGRLGSLGANGGIANSALDAFRRKILGTLGPAAVLVSYLQKLGARAQKEEALGLGAPGTMMTLEESFASVGRELKIVEPAAAQFNGTIGNLGGTAKGTSAGMRELARESEEASRKLQGLVDRLNPRAAADRQLAADLSVIESSKELTEAKKVELEALRRAEDFRKNTRGLGDATVSKGLLDTKPLVDSTEQLDGVIDDLRAKAEAKTVQIADSFAQMAQRITSSLQGLANGIKSGDLLGILGGVLDILSQLGSAGAFGKGFAAKLNAPASFDGGGFTGMGARAGGLDGKGGFLAMLHPRESVLDHTKGQGIGGGRVHVTVGIDPENGNVTAFVNGQIAATAPAIANAGAQMAQGQMAQRESRRVR